MKLWLQGSLDFSSTYTAELLDEIFNTNFWSNNYTQVCDLSLIAAETASEEMHNGKIANQENSGTDGVVVGIKLGATAFRVLE